MSVTTSIDFEAKAREALQSHGLTPDRIIMDGNKHRFSTHVNKRKDTAGWYRFFDDGVYCWGAFGDYRSQPYVPFNGKSNKQMSAQERIEYKERQRKLRQKHERERREAERRAAIKAAKIVDRMDEDVKFHPYIVRKKIQPYGNIGKYFSNFIVPCYNEGNLVSVQMIAPNGDKLFLKESKISSSYFVIGNISDSKEVILSEGYATGCTLHEATKLPVVVAFNAFNMPKVAKYFNKQYGNKTWIVAGDNDHVTEAEKGKNTGVESAHEAATILKGIVRIPPTMEGVTDFNDYANVGDVKSLIFPEKPKTQTETQSQPENLSRHDAPFTILGRFAGKCYYIPKDGHIYEYAPASHNKQVLLSLASFQWWMNRYPNKEFDGIATDEAISDLLQQSENIQFDTSLRRGRGAWVDDDRIIIHQGTTILDVANGQSTKVQHFKSRYYYPKASDINESRVTALSNADSKKIFDVFDLLPLENKINNRLLAGWVVCAHLSGVLDWRPHIWITGRKSSGKSYIVNNMIVPLLGKNVLTVQSATTEAGIRQTLQGDAMPVVFDEAEGTGQRERDRLQKVLELARQASSTKGGVIAKGTAGGQAMSFMVRSCFAFSSISSSASQNSDKSRITQLEIDAKRYGTPEKFERIKQSIFEIFTQETIQSFYWRCVENAETVKKNADTFSEVLGAHLKDVRAGQQLGAMLAGAYLYQSTGLIKKETVQNWVNDRQDEDAWSPYLDELEDQSDEASLLSSIMQSHAIHQGQQKQISVLIDSLLEVETDSVTHQEITQTLYGYGIKLSDNNLIIANKCDNLKRCLKDTAFAENWAKTLQRLPYAQKSSQAVRFGYAVNSRATMIPLEALGID